MKLKFTIALVLLLSGCTPYIGYTHLSQPSIDNDGYDLVCGGIELEKNRLRLDTAVCENLARSGSDTYARIDARILL